MLVCLVLQHLLKNVRQNLIVETTLVGGKAAIISGSSPHISVIFDSLEVASAWHLVLLYMMSTGDFPTGTLIEDTPRYNTALDSKVR